MFGFIQLSEAAQTDLRGEHRGRANNRSEPSWEQPPQLGSYLALAWGSPRELGWELKADPSPVVAPSTQKPLSPCVHAGCQILPDDNTMSACVSFVCILACVGPHLCQMNVLRIFSKATSKLINRVCFIKHIKEITEKVKSASINRIWHLFCFIMSSQGALIWIGNVVNNWAWSVTDILSADSDYSSGNEGEASLICHALCAKLRPSKTDKAIPQTQYNWRPRVIWVMDW